ncbi:hypothetical protein WR25_24582 [Diploscapter pachys]|uniref:Uncharacterized protein n=1 Tax=Diploscapter pachys TaxID=2018661 RepID=A0A2A2JBY7_9BILA|nr:hypothetical protein WR25_24582 [Diploscapter pachys]
MSSKQKTQEKHRDVVSSTRPTSMPDNLYTTWGISNNSDEDEMASERRFLGLLTSLEVERRQMQIDDFAIYYKYAESVWLPRIQLHLLYKDLQNEMHSLRVQTYRYKLSNPIYVIGGLL